jgi:hypothetical protein
MLCRSTFFSNLFKAVTVVVFVYEIRYSGEQRGGVVVFTLDATMYYKLPERINKQGHRMAPSLYMRPFALLLFCFLANSNAQVVSYNHSSNLIIFADMWN